MTLNAHHRIDEMVFDITFDSMSSPHARESALHSLMVEELLPVVDEVFTRHGGGDRVWRIDRLEIDIGDVPEQDFAMTIAARLRESLERALFKKLAIAGQVMPSDYPEHEDVRVTPRRQADEDLLSAYLTTGGMPWQANASRNQEHEAVLGRLLQGGMDGLFAFLRGSPERNTTLSRLAQQFPESQLYEVLQHLTPAHFHRFQKLIEALHQLLEAANDGGPRQHRAAHLVWVSVFDVILDAPGRAPDATALIRNMITQLAALRATTPESALAWLAGALPRLQEEQGKSGSRGEIAAVLDKLNGEPGGAGAMVTGTPARAETAADPNGQVPAEGPPQAESTEFGEVMNGKSPLCLLFKKIRDGRQPLIREAISLADLERMLAMFAASGMPAEATSRTLFMQAVSSHAEAAGDRHRFLAEVLTALAHERIVDLEAIVEISCVAAEQADIAGPEVSVPMPQGGSEAGRLDPERLRDRLARALLSGEAAGIYEHWDILASRYPASVREALQHYGMHDEVLARIALGFPESMLQDMIALLAPDAARAMRPLWSEPTLFEKGVETGPGAGRGASGLSWAGWKRQIWKAGVHYLLRANVSATEAYIRGGTFRFEDYIDALLPAVAGAPATCEKAWAAAWKEEAGKEFGDAEFADAELADAELADKDTADTETGDSAATAVPHVSAMGSAPEDAVKDNVGIAPIVMALERFMNALESSSHPNKDGDAPDKDGEGYSKDSNLQEPHGIASFDGHSKERLQSYFEELRSCAAQLKPSDWTVNNLESLVFAFISLDMRPTVADRGPFLKAIASHASSAGNRHQYFTHVLAALIDDRVLDLEAIVAACNPAESALEARAHAIEATAVSSSISGPRVLEPGGDDVHLRRLLSADFLGGRDPPPEWRAWLVRTLGRKPSSLRQPLITLLQDPRVARRLLAVLPASSWTHLLETAATPAARRAGRCADDVADSFASLHHEIPPSRIVQLTREYVLPSLFAPDFHFEAPRFAQQLLDYLAHATNRPVTPQLVQLVRRRTGLAVAPEFVAAEFEPKAPSASQRPAIATPRAGTPAPAGKLADSKKSAGGDIYVVNAGQVLAAPYLPRLWSTLDLTENGAFKGLLEAERAIHLLQFMASESTSSPEYQLVLNKILCGIPAAVPIARGIDIQEKEIEVVEQLLAAMIQHWKIIGNTSITGLRESFMQRPGWLSMKDDAWHLRIQEQAFDMLLDQLPWSFSIIRYSWMERPVHVKWR